MFVVLRVRARQQLNTQLTFSFPDCFTVLSGGPFLAIFGRGVSIRLTLLGDMSIITFVGGVMLGDTP